MNFFRFLSLLLTVAAGPFVHALGTVNLNNNFNLPGTATKAYVLGTDGRPLPKASGLVEILDSDGQILRSGPFVFDGIFFFGVTEIPGTVPGGSGLIYIRVWDKTTGDTYDRATVRAEVPVALSGLGGEFIPAANLGTAGDFAGIDLRFSTPSPWVSIQTIEAAGSGVLVRAAGTPEHLWRLWSSIDLVNWFPASDSRLVPTLPELGQNLGQVEWTVSEAPAASFYRVHIEF